MANPIVGSAANQTKLLRLLKFERSKRVEQSQITTNPFEMIYKSPVGFLGSSFEVTEEGPLDYTQHDSLPVIPGLPESTHYDVDVLKSNMAFPADILGVSSDAIGQLSEIRTEEQARRFIEKTTTAEQRIRWQQSIDLVERSITVNDHQGPTPIIGSSLFGNTAARTFKNSYNVLPKSKLVATGSTDYYAPLTPNTFLFLQSYLMNKGNFTDKSPVMANSLYGSRVCAIISLSGYISLVSENQDLTSQFMFGKDVIKGFPQVQYRQLAGIDFFIVPDGIMESGAGNYGKTYETDKTSTNTLVAGGDKVAFQKDSENANDELNFGPTASVAGKFDVANHTAVDNLDVAYVFVKDCLDIREASALTRKPTDHILEVNQWLPAVFGKVALAGIRMLDGGYVRVFYSKNKGKTLKVTA